MRLSTLICCSLLAFAANAQTKEAEFKKVESILKRTNGLITPNFKLVDFVFNEKSVRVDAIADGKNVAITGNPDWNDFSYYIKKVKDNDKVSTVSFSFDEEFDIIAYENKKQVDKMKDDEMEFYISTADANLLKQQLEELQTYTWKVLNELRTADKSSLVRFLTKQLSVAVDDDGGKLKTITDCEITFTYDDDEITVPTKKLTIHSKELLSKEHLICYGKQGAPIKIRKNSTTQTKSVEHPEIELSFEGPDDKVTPVKYAIERLAGFCKS